MKKTLQSLFNERTSAILALISLIVAITFGVLQFRPKTREITCSVSSTELTSVSQVPGLSSAFTYQGINVAHLWKIDMYLVNSGNETLIGAGHHTSLLRDGLQFNFPESTKILNSEIYGSDFAAKAESVSPNTFLIKFEQWRSGEQIGISLYATSEMNQSSPLIPYLETRDVVDGNVIIRSVGTATNESISGVNKLPPSLRLILKIFITLVTSLAAGMFIGFIFVVVVPDMHLWYWKKVYFEKFRYYINTLEITDEDKQLVLSHPEKLRKDLWDKFEGKRWPNHPNPGFQSFLSILLVGLAVLVGLILALIYIVTILYDLVHLNFGRF
ncbi:MAG TPA: hypothetical protein VF703_08415 [Pyrinomonadaceae bacterium]|jgi:hypothetical protein